MIVANPIYDIVFKYLMEDERIARTIQKIDESAFADDADMEHILHRLTMAAADADMRHKMNVEDEYFSAIEKRDTELLMKDRQLAEMNVQLSEKNAQLSENKALLSEQEEMLRTTVKMLIESGKHIEDVAKSLGKDIDTIKRML